MFSSARHLKFDPLIHFTINSFLIAAFKERFQIRKIQFLLINFDISHIHFHQFEPYLSSHRKVNFFLSMIVYSPLCINRVIYSPLCMFGVFLSYYSVSWLLNCVFVVHSSKFGTVADHHVVIKFWYCANFFSKMPPKFPDVQHGI